MAERCTSKWDIRKGGRKKQGKGGKNVRGEVREEGWMGKEWS